MLEASSPQPSIWTEHGQVYIGGEAIEAIDAEASVYGRGRGRGSKKFVLMIKLNASFVAIA